MRKETVHVVSFSLVLTATQRAFNFRQCVLPVLSEYKYGNDANSRATHDVGTIKPCLIMSWHP